MDINNINTVTNEIFESTPENVVAVGYGKKMVDGKMKYVIKEQLIKEIHANIIEFLQKYINKHRLDITRAMTECLKHYKLKNPDYIKKIILEEINLLGYVFYKNHIDIDINSYINIDIQINYYKNN
jgi:hypothetical protein